MAKERFTYDRAVQNLECIAGMTERERILLLLRTQHRLNNGDAMAYFGCWLEECCLALGIDSDAERAGDPFA